MAASSIWQRAGTAVESLDQLRLDVDTFGEETATVVDRYSIIVDELLALEADIIGSLSDTQLLIDAQATVAGLMAKDEVWRQIAFVGVRLEAGTFTGPDFATFTRQRDAELRAFESQLSSEDISSLWMKGLDTIEVRAGEDLVASILRSSESGSLPTVTAEVWWPTMFSKLEALDVADDGSFDVLIAKSAKQASAARNSAQVFLVIGMAAVLAAVVAALALARSIARRLRSLSEEAHHIANDRLPEVLESLRNPTPEALAGAMPTITSTARDEIGVMADSFNTVLRTSVETAIEHSQQRARALTDMLVNLGRRSQALIDTQLKLIDELESNQEDPTVLKGLYRLDSLVTRNRRNAENLLVLAGEHTARPWNDPVPLVDLVRGAMSEVNGLERVQVKGGSASGDRVLGKAAVDLSHLIAELLENALSFSAPSTDVIVRIDSHGTGRRIWIIDSGIGLTPAELTKTNERLGSPTEIAGVTADRIGFQVVGRLAARLGLRVYLQENPSGGIAACVEIDGQTLHVESSATKSVSAKQKAKAKVQALRETGAAHTDDDKGATEPVVLDDGIDTAERTDLQPKVTPPPPDAPSTADTPGTTAADTAPNNNATTDDEPSVTVTREAPVVARTADGLLRRTPGTAYVGDRKAEEADKGTFRRLGSGAKKSNVAEVRQDMLSALRAGVDRGRVGDESDTVSNTEGHTDRRDISDDQENER